MYCLIPHNLSLRNCWPVFVDWTHCNFDHCHGAARLLYQSFTDFCLALDNLPPSHCWRIYFELIGLEVLSAS